MFTIKTREDKRASNQIIAVPSSRYNVVRRAAALYAYTACCISPTYVNTFREGAYIQEYIKLIVHRISICRRHPTHESTAESRRAPLCPRRKDTRDLHPLSLCYRFP